MLWKRTNLRENEAITVQPFGVLGVELHELVEKDVGNRCHAPVCEVLSATVLSTLFMVLCAHFSHPQKAGDATTNKRGRNVHGRTGVTGVCMSGCIGLDSEIL